jgi:hypothetical protein
MSNLFAAIYLEACYQLTVQKYPIVPSRKGWFKLGQQIIAAHPEYLKK